MPSLYSKTGEFQVSLVGARLWPSAPHYGRLTMISFSASLAKRKLAVVLRAPSATCAWYCP